MSGRFEAGGGLSSAYLYCIGRIQEDCAPGKEAVSKSLTIQDAVARNLQILCESTQRLAPESQAQHPEIDWKGVSGFRNVLTHDYVSLDFETIWSIIEPRLAASGTCRPQLAGG
jgi:uncharacterized protein with HEPN domain